VFVTFEGQDWSGKSTQARLLAETLRGDGRDVVATREPGGTPVGEAIRALVLEGPEMTPWAEAALFAAARAEHVAVVIRPALERGAAIVCDRYVDSSVAYQGGGRELGIERVLDLNLIAVDGLMPDTTFLLEMTPEAGLARINRSRDRIELEDGAFRERAAAAYRELADRFPERIRVLDGGRPVDDLAEEVYAGVRRRS
jgi:dTMP kinase